MATADGAAQQLAELLSAPLEHVVVAVGRGIGEAQAALAEHSIEIQRQMDEHPLLSQYGLSATWFQIPTSELQLKIAVSIQGVEQPPAGSPVLGQLPTRVWVQPA